MSRFVESMKVKEGQEWRVQEWAKNCGISPDSEITDDTLIAFRLIGVEFYDVIYKDEINPVSSQAESDAS